MRSETLQQLISDDPIAITGMGVHCAAGNDVPTLWKSVLAGATPVRDLPLPGDGCFPAYLAADLDPGRDLRLRAGRRTDRSVQMALAAAVEAVDQAGDLEGARLSVIAGTSRGPQQHWDFSRGEMEAGRRLRPTAAANGTVACLSGLLSQQLGATAPGFTVSATCSSGASAISLAAQQLLLGEADVALAGGSDAPVHPLVLAGMQSAGMLGSACRPFDLRRDGLVVGEGAGFVVLERLAHARERGAEVLAVLEGWATGLDIHGRTGIREDGAGLVDVLGKSLATAGLDPGDISYVNAHGTATELNDRVEAAVLRETFGMQVPVSSTKAVTGHCLGATPAIEAIIAVMALREGLLPVTAGLDEIAPECGGIDLITGTPRQCPAGHVVSESIGFWGYHACLIFGQPA